MPTLPFCHVLQEALTRPSPYDGHMRFSSAKPLHSNVVPIPYMRHVHHINTAMRADMLANKAASTRACALQLWAVCWGPRIKVGTDLGVRGVPDHGNAC